MIFGGIIISIVLRDEWRSALKLSRPYALEIFASYNVRTRSMKYTGKYENKCAAHFFPSKFHWLRSMLYYRYKKWKHAISMN